MKKILFLVMLFSIIEEANAQSNKSNFMSDFELPPASISREFSFALGKGNSIRLELGNIKDLAYFNRFDSILRIFFSDVETLNLKAPDKLKSFYIQYIIDTSGVNKIRINEIPVHGKSFIVKKSQSAILKISQDTIKILGAITDTGKAITTVRKRFYRITIYINDVNDLPGYLDGRLAEKIRKLNNNRAFDWEKKKDGNFRLKKEPSISAQNIKGFIESSFRLKFYLATEIQNYKNHFVPSASLGIRLINDDGIKYSEFGLFGESHFTFSTSAGGQTKTSVNNFISVEAGSFSKQVKENWFNIFKAHGSIGILISRKGNVFDKGTFRLGTGRISLFKGRTNIEPIIYFHDLFKNVTPGIRLKQYL